ncbi:MAG TPA: radical SAM protein [Nitrospirae bacterium]|nr:radical SAM protein [Nitrospirota bacterium]HDO23140.1 radical SAM protein [Nitrospirota bacterium]HDZ88113.1 radical SAM protein [Nitrospirota bacterium]
MSSSSPAMLIHYSRLAELATTRPHYKRAIRRIREMWLNGHPSLGATMKILKKTSSKHKKKIVKNFIINQLLVGSTRRKLFSEQEGGFYPPGLLVISPSMKCNLNCFGCYAGKYSKDEDLPFEVIDRILNEAKEMGIYFIVISGGEPFFRKDIFDIFEKHSDMAFHVFTHGGLLNEERVDRLAGLGNVLPAISVEGFRKETNARRGTGHYEKVLNAMKLLKEAGVLFAYSATVTNNNAELLVSDEFVDFWMDQGCTVGWYFLYTPVGRDTAWELVPTPEQRDMLRQRVEYLRSTKKMFFGDFWNDGPVVGGCIAGGRKYLHINSKGDVEPCVFCHFAMHNIKDTSLREAVTSPMFRKIRENQMSNKNLLQPCMIVDHPEQYREVCNMPGVKFTHEGAENIITSFAPLIDRYASEWGLLAEKAWNEKNGKISC